MFGVKYEIWAAMSMLIRIVAYIPYFAELIKGKCHPHAFSWLIWFLIDFIAFVIQYHEGAGSGAYATLFACSISFLIAVLSWFIGKRNVKRSDYIAFIIALLMLPLWYFANTPLMVLCVIICVDFIGTVPTLRKATFLPNEERAYLFFMIGLSSIFTIMAIEILSIENVIYPFYIMLSSIGTALYILWRQKVLEKK